MKNPIKKALTRTISVRTARTGENQQVEIPPNQKLLYGIYFAVAALACLTALEITHIIMTETFSSEIFAAITLVIGTILGAFFSQKS